MKSAMWRSTLLFAPALVAVTARAGLPVPGPPWSATPDWIALAISVAGAIGIIVIRTNRYVRER